MWVLHENEHYYIVVFSRLVGIYGNIVILIAFYIYMYIWYFAF